MMLGIREYDKDNNSLKLLSIVDLKESDISETVKTLKFFKDNNLYISIDEECFGDSADNPIYSIKYIEFKFPSSKISEEDKTVPSITVDVVEEASY